MSIVLPFVVLAPDPAVPEVVGATTLFDAGEIFMVSRYMERSTPWAELRVQSDVTTVGPVGAVEEN